LKVICFFSPVLSSDSISTLKTSGFFLQVVRLFSPFPRSVGAGQQADLVGRGLWLSAREFLPPARKFQFFVPPPSFRKKFPQSRESSRLHHHAPRQFFFFFTSMPSNNFPLPPVRNVRSLVFVIFLPQAARPPQKVHIPIFPVKRQPFCFFLSPLFFLLDSPAVSPFFTRTRPGALLTPP